MHIRSQCERTFQVFKGSQCEQLLIIEEYKDMRIEKANHIHAALLAKGMSCRSWALSNGYNPRTVQKCVKIFAPATGHKPRTELSKMIMFRLSLAIDFDLVGASDD